RTLRSQGAPRVARVGARVTRCTAAPRRSRTDRRNAGAIFSRAKAEELPPEGPNARFGVPGASDSHCRSNIVEGIGCDLPKLGSQRRVSDRTAPVHPNRQQAICRPIM